METVEETILIMKDLLVSQELDNFYAALDRERLEREESRRDFEFKMNVLISAQMNNEAEIAELKESTTKLKESTTKLKESSTQLRRASESQLNRIKKLEENKGE